MLVALFAVAVAAAWWFTTRHQQSAIGDQITVYYAKADGTTLVPWTVSLNPDRRDRNDAALDRRGTIFYAATQCVAGPPPGTEAVRFPAGTHVIAVDVQGSTVDVDISNDVASSAEGGFAESAEFKALVWTLTQPKFGIDSVKVRVAGKRVATLPGGHLELDEPLSRSSF